MVNYRFNIWMVSEKKATEFSYLGYELLRQQVGAISGAAIGEVLYRHFKLGEQAQEIKKDFMYIPLNTIKGMTKGKYAPESFRIFMLMLETEPEVLDRMFSDVEGVASWGQKG